MKKNLDETIFQFEQIAGRVWIWIWECILDQKKLVPYTVDRSLKLLRCLKFIKLAADHDTKPMVDLVSDCLRPDLELLASMGKRWNS